MICECGHNEEQHGPEGSDRICSLCLCNVFQEVIPDIDLNLRASEELALEKMDNDTLIKVLLAQGSNSTLYIEVARRLREQGERIEGWIPNWPATNGIPVDEFIEFHLKRHTAVQGDQNVAPAILILNPQEPEDG